MSVSPGIVESLMKPHETSVSWGFFLTGFCDGSAKTNESSSFTHIKKEDKEGVR